MAPLFRLSGRYFPAPTPMTPSVIIAKGDADFVAQGLDCLKKEITGAIAQRKTCILGLSGGSTPRPMYEALGKENIDWSNVWIFLVDDRYIRADDPSSNQFLLRSTLLKNAPIPESQIIFPDTSLPLMDCVKLYGKQLESLFKKSPPDIVTLGMGDDGHIASLFPPLTDEAFGPGTVIHTTTDKFAVRDRISVTIPTLRQARQSVFFLKGLGKRKVWEEMVASNEDERRWPGKATGMATIIGQW